MRLLLAALVAFALIIGSGGLIERLPDSMSTLASILAPIFAILLVLVVFNKGMFRRLLISNDKYVQTELDKGRATKTEFRASRAISIEVLRTGCMTHFIELDQGGVLCLYGQYLYEYEPIDDDPELNQPRRFPTSEFSAVRSVKDQELLDFIVGTQTIQTDVLKDPEDYKALHSLGFHLEDGEIVTDVTLSQVQAAVTSNQN